NTIQIALVIRMPRSGVYHTVVTHPILPDPEAKTERIGCTFAKTYQFFDRLHKKTKNKGFLM
ncbi:MAG TPA: hypothetical protein V6D18_00030, partial [Thermosynechococcaceae cyanobacterium]